MSAGTAAMTAPVFRAAAAISAIAETSRFRVSAMTAAIRNTWWLQRRRLLRYLTLSSAVDAAPLLCAGITTFNSLRHSGALPGDLVAVQGIGGLGHLGIQFASKFGYQVAAIGRGSENAAFAKKLGANVYIDSKSRNAAEELQKLGGARVILATAPNSKSMSAADRRSRAERQTDCPRCGI